MEVLGRRGERHLRPERPLVLDQHPHEAVVQGGVGEDVDHGRTGREHSVLDSQVRPAAPDVVDRAVPAVDRAVVQSQLLEPRHAAAGQDLDGVLVVADRQQSGEVPDVLLE